MTDAPERIWTTGNTNTDHGLTEVEYIRKDLAKPKVKPLEWVRTQEDTGWSAVAVHSVYYVLDDGYWYLWASSTRVLRGQEYNSEQSKAAAQADYERRILSALK